MADLYLDRHSEGRQEEEKKEKIYISFSLSHRLNIWEEKYTCLCGREEKDGDGDGDREKKSLNKRAKEKKFSLVVLPVGCPTLSHIYKFGILQR